MCCELQQLRKFSVTRHSCRVGSDFSHLIICSHAVLKSTRKAALLCITCLMIGNNPLEITSI